MVADVSVQHIPAHDEPKRLTVQRRSETLGEHFMAFMAVNNPAGYKEEEHDDFETIAGILLEVVAEPRVSAKSCAGFARKMVKATDRRMPHHRALMIIYSVLGFKDDHAFREHLKEHGGQFRHTVTMKEVCEVRLMPESAPEPKFKDLAEAIRFLRHRRGFLPAMPDDLLGTGWEPVPVAEKHKFLERLGNVALTEKIWDPRPYDKAHFRDVLCRRIYGISFLEFRDTFLKNYSISTMWPKYLVDLYREPLKGIDAQAQRFEYQEGMTKSLALIRKLCYSAEVYAKLEYLVSQHEAAGFDLARCRSGFVRDTLGRLLYDFRSPSSDDLYWGGRIHLQVRDGLVIDVFPA